MINNLNAPALDPSTAPLIEQIARRVDADGNGSVSTTEFSRFLADLLTKIAGGSSPLNAAANAAAPTGTWSVASSMENLPPCPPGCNPEKWCNPNHQTPKYVVGRILHRYPPTPEGLQQALATIQQALPGTELIGDDKLRIPNVGTVDVGVKFASGGGVGWSWRVTE